MNTLQNVDLDMSLPLISFGLVLGKTRDTTWTNADSPIPLEVIESVEAINFRRRMREGDATFHTDLANVEELHHYGKLRLSEFTQQTFDDRVNLFIDGKYMSGYEIFARSRLGEVDFFSSDFAVAALRKIALDRNLAHIQEIREGPIRISKVDNAHAVIRSKLTLGLIDTLHGDIVLKTRRAGAALKEDVSSDDWQMMRNLSQRKIGAEDTDETTAWRKHLREMFQGNPALRPVMESLYLTRERLR